jgi:hypothetical protein
MVTPMSDARIESFLADVLALEGESLEAIRDGVHIALTDCGEIYRAQEVNRRMKDKAVHACHALCRARIVEEMQRRKGTASAEHLRSVLNVIDGPRLPERHAKLTGIRVWREGKLVASSRQKQLQVTSRQSIRLHFCSCPNPVQS